VWSLALREGHRLRVFKKRALRRIFTSKTQEVAREGWKGRVDRTEEIINGQTS
jgi:hypothetical protein